MIDNIDIANVLFLDIETVSAKPDYQSLDDDFKELWALKARQFTRHLEGEAGEEELEQLYHDKAGIFAEFGKIVCISVGVVHRDKDDQLLRVRLKSFASENELELLNDFSQLIFKFYNNASKFFFCGHNIKEFDVPYICRRLVVNQLPLPNVLDLFGKKPWETQHLLDTLELWKFGDRKHFTSLKLLAALLGFPSPKDDIDGSDVGRVYWQDKDLGRIAFYCEKDVLATIQLFLRYKRMPLLEENQIAHVK
ncbi:MAG: ribonuclease H-like domain-containing protein [Phaeodactylibacter sp.]|nr:ribonuclease H-like domain-containing protein [Phaeodactylibacter sp.]MCB9276078.1 ribonuclease H-like domain-containing protein [Lewinellaceae bacterium]